MGGNERQMLIILVGKSGVDKTTFAKSMNCPGHLFVSSKTHAP